MIVTDAHLRILSHMFEHQPVPRDGVRERTLRELLRLRFIELTPDRCGWVVTGDGRQWLRDHPLPAQDKA